MVWLVHSKFKGIKRHVGYGSFNFFIKFRLSLHRNTSLLYIQDIVVGAMHPKQTQQQPNNSNRKEVNVKETNT